MAGFRVTADISVRKGDGQPRDAEPDVLELRVHGVNNTTPANLLDLPADAVEVIAGDKLGSFWMPKAGAPTDDPTKRGFVPEGVRREAYSWGGMVRTTPNFGGVGAAGVVAGVVARVLYAILLPFSIGNAVQWARRITLPTDSGAAVIAPAVTAALARLFGLVLTLLFTATAAILSIDILAAQCAVDPTLCAPIAGILQPIAGWPPGARLALFALGPVVAAFVLWLVSALSRQRYDVLPGMEGNRSVDVDDGTKDEAPEPPQRSDRDRPVAPLSQPAFWANRITAHLARAHLAAAIAFTAGIVAVQAAMRGYTSCLGLGGWDSCIGAAATDPGYQRFVGVAIAAAVSLAVAAVVVVILPTQSLTAEEGEAAPWSGWVSAATLGLSVLVFAVVLVFLVFFTDPSAFAIMAQPDYRGLYGGGFVPLALVGAGGVLALTGIAWRPWRGRRSVAWAGCGPAVLMTISLVVATATSAIFVVTIGDLLNDSLGAASLVRTAGQGGLNVPSSFVALGAVIVTAALAAIVVIVILVLVRPRRFAARAAAWGAPSVPGERVVETKPGVMPVSQRGLFARIDAKRITAGRLHLVEPATSILTVFLAIAVVAGVAWTLLAYTAGVPLWDAMGALDPAGVRGFIDAGMWGLAALGLLLVAVLASGATSGAPRPLGIVWDIACYLPRTGHPFGPPSFAERAVPEIAGRLYAWLTAADTSGRRAVLVAHSMGGVLAVSSLGLLASSPHTRRVLADVSLLTFGVQLRAFFGRMLPDLLGPDVLGTRPSRGPGLFAADPWGADAAAERGEEPATPAEAAPKVLDRLRGTLLPGEGVRWISLWRLTDFLGFPAMSTARGDAAGTWVNAVDRYATELDMSGYMVEVGTHGEYFREPEYTAALEELTGVRTEGA